MSGRSTRVQLSVDIGSEPISGEVTVETEHPRPFSGWIELTAAIESARSHRGDQSPGWLPGANGVEL